MATATAQNPSRDDFAAMLEESFQTGNLQEGSVIKGIVVGIEKEVAKEEATIPHPIKKLCASHIN